MANRALYSDVEGILETELTNDEITAYITTANLVVTAQLGNTALSAALLTQIETYLAAHLISTTRERKAEQVSGEGGVRFEGKTGMRLEATHYGQMVMMLDSTGRLAALNRGPLPVVSFEVL